MMMGFGLVALLLLAGGLVTVLVGVPALASGKRVGVVWADGEHHRTARQILDERLARGEISRDEHEAIRARIAE
jgi:uncharacterized membrane protein